MTLALVRKEPERTGKPILSGAGKDRKHTPKGVPVLSGVDGRSVSARPSPTSGLPSLSPGQIEALRKYSKDTERAETSRDADRRLEARQSLASARSAIGSRGAAIIDLVLIKGRGLSDLARISGQPVGDLATLLTTTATALADHYQNREARHG